MCKSAHVFFTTVTLIKFLTVLFIFFKNHEVAEYCGSLPNIGVFKVIELQVSLERSFR